MSCLNMACRCMSYHIMSRRDMTGHVTVGICIVYLERLKRGQGQVG